VVRALVERGLEDYSSAIGHARASAQTFVAYADHTKHASARLAQVHFLFSTGEVKTAHDILLDLKREFEQSSDLDTYARILGNLGHCCGRLRRSEEALFYHGIAAKLFEDLGVHSAAVRESWNVARVLMQEGRFDEAVPRQEKLRREFEQLGMMASYSQVTLELAEILVMRSDFKAVEDMCFGVMRVLQEKHLQHTAPALTALALMREAARKKTATPALVRHVREYLERVPNEPNLLFAFPPQ